MTATDSVEGTSDLRVRGDKLGRCGCSCPNRLADGEGRWARWCRGAGSAIVAGAGRLRCRRCLPALRWRSGPGGGAGANLAGGNRRLINAVQARWLNRIGAGDARDRALAAVCLGVKDVALDEEVLQRAPGWRGLLGPVTSYCALAGEAGWGRATSSQWRSRPGLALAYCARPRSFMSAKKWGSRQPLQTSPATALAASRLKNQTPDPATVVDVGADVGLVEVRQAGYGGQNRSVTRSW